MTAAKKSQELKPVMSGAQRRNQRVYTETVDKIKNGAIGDVVATYTYRSTATGDPAEGP